MAAGEARRRVGARRRGGSEGRSAQSAVQVMRGDVLSGEGLERGAGGRGGRLLPDPLDGALTLRVALAVSRARALGAENFAAAAARRACAASSTSAGSLPACARTRAAPRDRARRVSRHLASREAGRAHAARRRPGLGRAARVDRDRRALALVPPAGAPASSACPCSRCPPGDSCARSRSTRAT